jgi:hypothetical protein
VHTMDNIRLTKRCGMRGSGPHLWPAPSAAAPAPQGWEEL